ncbi:Adenylate cyclase (EC [Olavius algarvensis associated proteobacterium Delta 3]|nr:Adenylate cyclase (EC [Olavius algarvensis associated proteobacterium Delta 3]CAB5134023.1 Adenylate cyclase (EC [Olavius algarvensis associated proteobacterium Delta 3]
MKMFKNFGVRGRLLLSFIGISGFAVLATLAAMYSFLLVQTIIDKITEQRVPAALAAQKLSSRVERIIAETPPLLAASAPEERSQVWDSICTEIKSIDQLLLIFRPRGVAVETLASLQNVLDSLRSNLFSLNTLLGERIVLAERKAFLLGEMQNAHDETHAVLGPWITSVKNSIQRLRTTLDDSRTSPTDRSTAEKELIASLTLFASLQQIFQSVTEIHASLVGTASARDHEHLHVLKLRTQWSLAALDTLATVVGSQPRQLIVAELERLRLFAEGENNLPWLRARELTLIANAENVQRENLRLSRDLTELVELFVIDTQRDISRATSQARAVQAKSSIILALIVSLSLASSVLIVWLYVGRNLIARLTALSSSMSAIAGGNLRTTLPPTGSDEIGRMAAALAVFRDTAAEVEEKNLREIAEARQRLVDAVESISEGFVLYDKEDRLVLSNSRYRELLHPGWETEFPPGTRFTKIIRTAAECGLVIDAKGRVDEWVAQRLAQHRNPTGPIVQRRAKGRWIQISERKTSEGGTVAVYTDISKLKQHEAELSELVKKLEVTRDIAMAANRHKSEFLANMSHELRTPLNAILGYTELIVDRIYGDVPEKIQEVLERVDENGRHLLRLINDVLDLSKIEAGHLDLSPSEFSIGDLIHSVTASVEALAAAKNLQVTVNVPKDLRNGFGDEQRIAQVLLNLLGNAIKFTEHGKVGVGVTEADGKFIVSVSDTGIGLSDEDQLKIFDEFHQVDGSSTREKGGTGLGLAIAKKIVEMHRGHIEVESILGKGSTFRFYLPIRMESQEDLS